MPKPRPKPLRAELTASLSPVPTRQPLPTFSRSWAEHVDRWRSGCGSTECAGARNVVLGRGSVPCDVAFIGEGPGESEDVIGDPFVGPAGKLLDQIIAEGLAGVNLTYALGNLVGCIPRDHEQGGKAGEPTKEQVQCCSGRLQDFIALCDRGNRLKLVVCVGTLARDYLDPEYKKGVKLHRDIPQINITHPAAILRASVVQQGMMIQKCVVRLANAVEELAP